MYGAGRALRLLIASLLASIAIEWIGMHLWWPELGTEHSGRMVEAESTFLEQTLATRRTRTNPIASVVHRMSVLGDDLNRTALADLVGRWNKLLTNRLNTSAAWRQFRDVIDPYLIAAGNIVRLYAIRLTVLCLAAPLFAMLVWVGLVDGLVQRDLRRWGGGRESSFVYHYAKRSNTVFVGSAAILYLAMPVSLHPAVILLPFSIACAVTASLTASRFQEIPVDRASVIASVAWSRHRPNHTGVIAPGSTGPVNNSRLATSASRADRITDFPSCVLLAASLP